MASRLQISPIPTEHPKADMWKTKIVFHPPKEGVEGESSVAYAEFVSQYGTLLFGLGSDGRVGWAWKETGGGGAVTLMFALTPGASVLDGLLIGLRIEDRQNMGRASQPCIVGGFQKPGEGAHVAHVREFNAETGGEAVRDVELPGLPFNSNRLYFVADPMEGEGCHAFAVEIPYKDLVPALDGTMEHATWKPNGARLWFVPWRMAARHTPDALAGLPILRLLAQLTEK